MTTALARVARSLIEAGKVAEALPLLERAVSLGERRHAHPLSLAEARFQLARALWQSGDQSRALALAEAARVTFAVRRQPELKELERSHRARARPK